MSREKYTKEKNVKYGISNDLWSIILRHNHVRESLLTRHQGTELWKVSWLTLQLLLSWCISDSLHLAQKYARIFVRGHHLFREHFSESVARGNCEFPGSNNVRRQISEPKFAPNGGFWVYYPFNVFRNTRGFEILGFHVT